MMIILIIPHKDHQNNNINIYNHNHNRHHSNHSSSSSKYNLSQHAQMAILIKQYTNQINELKDDIRNLHNQNAQITREKETIQLTMEAQIDQLSLEMENCHIEAQQYQIRYQEIDEELNELRGSQMELQASGDENKELLARLHNKEQNEVQLIMEVEKLNKANATIKEQLKNSQKM